MKSAHQPLQTISSTVNQQAPMNQHPKFFANVGDPALKRSFKGHKDVITGINFNPNLK